MPSRNHSTARTLAAAFVALASLAGCSSASVGPTASPTPAKTLTVFAAASLKGAFTKIATGFQSDNPGVTVTYNFDGSSTLVDQLKGGAQADVFASADEANMKKATDASLIKGTPQVFATNVLTLVVPVGNPGKITGLDSSLDGKKLVICAAAVPCGSAAQTLAKNLGITLKPVSEEQKVTDVLGKVTSGEADAGLVYTTDAKTVADKVAVVAVPGSDKVVNRYPIAPTTGAKDTALASAFVTYVTGSKGQQALADFGFGKP